MQKNREHPEFDAICSQLEEFEPIPNLVHAPGTPPAEPPHNGDQPATEIDEQILAGLVSL
jgi:hypothetical protein